MNAPLIKSPRAKGDIIAPATYLDQVRPGTGDRFLGAAAQALDRIAGMPGLGAPWDSPNPRLHDVRTWAVPGFRNHIIFYRATGAGIELLRVLHGARDANSLLGEGP